jgi:type II secretory pathway pseudopilin PulG
MAAASISSRSRAARGFTLVEVSVALWILIVALLAGIALVLQQPRVVRRIDAGRQAVRVMEWTVEEMRVGIIPLQSTEDVGWSFREPWLLKREVPLPPALDLKIAVDVVPSATPGLYEVSVEARYTVDRYAQRRRLQTMIWRPSGAPQ